MCFVVALAAGVASGEAALAMSPMDKVAQNRIVGPARRRDLKVIQLIKHMLLAGVAAEADDHRPLLSRSSSEVREFPDSLRWPSIPNAAARI